MATEYQRSYCKLLIWIDRTKQTGDIIKLSKYLDVELKKRMAAYEEECTASIFEDLAKSLWLSSSHSTMVR